MDVLHWPSRAFRIDPGAANRIVAAVIKKQRWVEFRAAGSVELVIPHPKSGQVTQWLERCC